MGLLAVTTMFHACNDFEQINIDPNNPMVVPAEMLLPSVVSGAAATMAASGRRAGQYVQHLAYRGGSSEADGRYNLTGASWREEWNGAMRLLKDINQMKVMARAEDSPQCEAVAHINKVYILSLMTDAFGDIPYNESGMGNVDGLEFATYQSQEEVYNLMLQDLETANKMLSELPNTVSINRDILYNGDVLQWRKFANSLKLRILMRQSAKKNVDSEVAAIFNNPAQYPVFTGVEDGATLVYNNDSDFYTWFIQNPPADGSGVNFGDDARISVTMVNMLKAAADPRLEVYAAPTRNSFLRAGGTENWEYRGQPTGLSSTEQTAYYNENNLNANDLSVVGRRIRQENRAFLMTYAELLLLKAEAIHREMGVNGSAAEVYQQAVNASFDKWKQVGNQSRTQNPYIDDNQKTAYWSIASNAYNPDRGMVQIAEQYYIDSFLNGFEGWASWRRTGIPNIQPGPSVRTNIPVRYVYSDNEQNNPKLVDWVNEHMGGKMPDHNVKVWFQP